MTSVDLVIKNGKIATSTGVFECGVAVEAGKHVFVEKPAAVDGPGVKMVLEAYEIAQLKNLGIAAGTQRGFYLIDKSTAAGTWVITNESGAVVGIATGDSISIMSALAKGNYQDANIISKLISINPEEIGGDYSTSNLLLYKQDLIALTFLLMALCMLSLE
jgi:hypothetical protein